MSQENVEVVRRGVEAWNQHDADLWLSYAAPEIEWMPAGPATVERTVYRGYEEVSTGFAAVWETWEEFRFEESEVRDLGDSVLWLGRVKMKGGASHVELDQEFAIHSVLRNGKVTAVRTFLAWEEALEAAGLSEWPFGRQRAASASLGTGATARRASASNGCPLLGHRRRPVAGTPLYGFQLSVIPRSRQG